MTDQATSTLEGRTDPRRTGAEILLGVEALWWIVNALLLVGTMQVNPAALVALVPAYLAILALVSIYLLIRSSRTGFWFAVVLQIPLILQGLATLDGTYFPALGAVLVILGAMTLVLAIAGRPRKARM